MTILGTDLDDYKEDKTVASVIKWAVIAIVAALVIGVMLFVGGKL